MKHLVLSAAALLVAYTFLFPASPAPEGPVAKALASASTADKAKVAGIYRSLADVVKRDSGQRISNTGAWRAIYRDALSLAAGGTDLPGKYPGLDTAVEEVLSKYYSLESAPIDKQLAEKISSACLEVARQAGG